MTITITRHDAGTSGEYHAAIAGSSTIGRLTYVRRHSDQGDVLVAEHTLVPAEIGGRGVAGKLVEALIPMPALSISASSRHAAMSRRLFVSVPNGPACAPDPKGIRDATRREFLDAPGNFVMSKVLRPMVPERGRALMRHIR